MTTLKISKIFEKFKTEQAEQLNKNGNLNADQLNQVNQSNGNAFSVTSAEQLSATAAENMANPTSAGTNNTVATTYNSAVRTYNLGTSNALTIQTFTSPQFGEAGTWAFNTHAYAGKYVNSFYYSVCTIDVAALAQFLNVSTEAIIYNSTLYFENFVATGTDVARFFNASNRAFNLVGSNTETIQLNISDFYNHSTGFVEFAVLPANPNVQGYLHFIPTSMNIVYPVDLSGITVTTPPNKTFYLVGETFESEGMVVSKIFSDGSSEVITDGLQFKRTGLSNEDVNFKISYGGKDTYLNLSLVQKFTYTHPTSQEQTMDIYVPVGLTQDVPAVITIHGGNWCGGGRSHYNYMTEFLTQTCGCAHVNMDYRLTTGQYIEGGITYVDMLEDINGVISYITNQTIASAYHIDTEKIALMGHSAGGHLALLYAYKAAAGDKINGLTMYPISLVISEAGPIEFKVQQVISLPPQNRNEICAMAGISSLADANAQTALDAVSPCYVVNNSTNNMPYTILAYSEADGLVPYASVNQLLLALRNNNNIFPLEKVGHSDFGIAVHPDMSQNAYHERKNTYINGIRCSDCEEDAIPCEDCSENQTNTETRFTEIYNNDKGEILSYYSTIKLKLNNS